MPEIKRSSKKCDLQAVGALESKSIILFDGVCNLCNTTVDFLMRRDGQDRLRFAALQSEAAQIMLRSVGVEAGGLGDPSLFKSENPPQATGGYGPQNEWTTVILIQGNKVHVRSAAIFRALQELGFFWRMIGFLGLCLPAFMRDGLYRCVSRWRYTVFGRRETCRIPSPEERKKFL